MADYDNKSRASGVVACPFAVVTATPTPLAVDLLDYGSCNFHTFVGAGGITFSTTNKIEFKVTESDDDVTYTAAPDDALILDPGATAPGDTGIVRSIIAAHASADTATPIVGYRGKKRYVKCTPVFGGTHGTGTLVGVIAERGHAYHGPIGASAVET